MSRRSTIKYLKIKNDFPKHHPNLDFLACEEVTKPPEKDKSSYHKQSFGTGTMRLPDDGTFNKIHVEKQEKLRERDQRERHFDDLSSSSHGIVIKQAPVPHVSHKPPGYNTRYVGKAPITGIHTGIQDTVFRPSGSGTRRDDMWIHQGISPNNVFLGHEEGIFMEEGVLMGANSNSGTPGECDVSCGQMEFFCSKSCSCIHSELHCGIISNRA